MFWESVKIGLSNLQHVNFYIALALYSVMVWVPVLLAGTISEKNPALGSVIFLIGGTLAQSLATFVFVVSILPILINASGEAIWKVPWMIMGTAPWFVIKTIGLMAIAAIVLGFIPVVGQFSSFTTFVESVVALMMVIPAIGLFPSNNIEFIPDLLTSLGFIVSSAFIGWCSFMIIVGPLVAMGKEKTASAQALAFVLGSAPGLVAALFYGAYVGQQI